MTAPVTCGGPSLGAPLTSSPNATQAPESILAEHYHDLRRKPFYPALISYMSSGPVVAMVWRGSGRVEADRAQSHGALSGLTSPNLIYLCAAGLGGP